MKKGLIVTLLFLVVLAFGVGGTYYFYDKYQKAQYIIDNPQRVAQDDIKILTDQLGKLMELPSDEQPQVGVITQEDLEKVKDQAFFSKAMSGDKVLIYNKAMKAILFRESANKIIEVAPVTISSPEPSVKTTPKPEAETTTSIEE
jgi:uncharacterized protein YneF (UPF0154 family)